MNKIYFFRYWDELLAVVSFVYLVLSFCARGRVKVKKLNGYLWLSFLVIVLLGIIGNVSFRNQNSSTAIALDVVANLKLPICCVAFYKYSSAIDTGRVLKKTTPFALAMICAALCLGVVSQFIDIGMRGQFRYGIWGFNFIYDYAHIFSMILLSCLLVFSYTVTNQKKFWILFLLVAVELLMTMKGISFGTCAVMFVIAFTYLYKNKISVSTLVILAIVSVGAGWNQIQAYFFGNPKAPRVMLLRYGARTLIDYFPFGSGFATFGSDMAAKYYSDLYYKYGFHTNWGTRVGSEFLNDSWWPIIMGQFGIIGLILVVILIYKIYSGVQENMRVRNCRIASITAIAYLLIASIGTTIFTTSATIILCMNLILVLNTSGNRKVNHYDQRRCFEARYEKGRFMDENCLLLPDEGRLL